MNNMNNTPVSIFANVSKASKLAFVCATLQEAYETTNHDFLVEQFTQNWNEGIKLVDALSFHKMITEHALKIREIMK